MHAHTHVCTEPHADGRQVWEPQGGEHLQRRTTEDGEATEQQPGPALPPALHHHHAGEEEEVR